MTTGRVPAISLSGPKPVASGRFTSSSTRLGAKAAMRSRASCHELALSSS